MWDNTETIHLMKHTVILVPLIFIQHSTEKLKMSYCFILTMFDLSNRGIWQWFSLWEGPDISWFPSQDFLFHALVRVYSPINNLRHHKTTFQQTSINKCAYECRYILKICHLKMVQPLGSGQFFMVSEARLPLTVQSFTLLCFFQSFQNLLWADDGLTTGEWTVFHSFQCSPAYFQAKTSSSMCRA